MWPLTDSLWIRLIPSSSATEFENDRSTHSLDTESDKLLVFQRIRADLLSLSFPSHLLCLTWRLVVDWQSDPYSSYSMQKMQDYVKYELGKFQCPFCTIPFHLISFLICPCHPTFVWISTFPEQARRVIAALKIRIRIFKNVDEAEEANERTKRG